MANTEGSDKRVMMIAEIEYWRKHKLLKSHYCDFLSNLYLEDQVDLPKSRLEKALVAVKHASLWRWLMICLPLIAFTFTLLNFNNFPIWLQILLSILFCGCIVWVSWRQRRRHPNVSYAGYGLAALIGLCAGAWLIDGLGGGYGIQTIYIACYGIALCLLGVYCKLPWFHLSGWLLLLAGYSSVIMTWHGAFSLAEWEMAWLPGSMLFAWLGWLLHRRHQAVGTVLLVVAMIAWLASPVAGLLLKPLIMGQLQWLLLAKLVLAVAILYTLRNKWIEWVV